MVYIEDVKGSPNRERGINQSHRVSVATSRNALQGARKVQTVTMAANIPPETYDQIHLNANKPIMYDRELGYPAYYSKAKLIRTHPVRRSRMFCC